MKFAKDESFRLLSVRDFKGHPQNLKNQWVRAATTARLAAKCYRDAGEATKAKECEEEADRYERHAERLPGL
jgi:hypothetical protein